MVLDSLSSPHRRSSSFKKHRDELGSWSVLLDRHRFLLSMLVLLLFLCTIYLYFAVTLGAASCAGMSGAEKALCEAKASSLHKGKLKFLWPVSINSKGLEFLVERIWNFGRSDFMVVDTVREMWIGGTWGFLWAYFEVCFIKFVM